MGFIILIFGSSQSLKYLISSQGWIFFGMPCCSFPDKKIYTIWYVSLVWTISVDNIIILMVIHVCFIGCMSICRQWENSWILSKWRSRAQKWLFDMKEYVKYILSKMWPTYFSRWGNIFYILREKIKTFAIFSD